MKRGIGLFAAVVTCAQFLTIPTVGAAGNAERWHLQPHSGPQFSPSNIAFADSQDGIAVGDYLASDAAASYTHDGGKTWSATVIASKSTIFTSVAYPATNEAWATSEDGGIWLSGDGGATWKAVVANLPSMWSIFFTDATHGWAVGGNSEITQYTAKSGWVSAYSQSDGSPLFSVFFLKDNRHGWVGGLGGVVLTTNDGGKWTVGAAAVGSRYVVSIFFHSTRLGWLGTDGSSTDGPYFQKSTNGGQSWAPETSPASFMNADLYFASASTGWELAFNTKGTQIDVTHDGGTKWVAISPKLAAFSGLAFFEDSATHHLYGWAVGQGYSSLYY